MYWLRKISQCFQCESYLFSELFVIAAWSNKAACLSRRSEKERVADGEADVVILGKPWLIRNASLTRLHRRFGFLTVKTGAGMRRRDDVETLPGLVGPVIFFASRSRTGGGRSCAPLFRLMSAATTPCDKGSATDPRVGGPHPYLKFTLSASRAAISRTATEGLLKNQKHAWYLAEARL
jgi:hypothetical protein